MRGFTFLELIIIVGGMIAIAALTLPAGFRFFQTQSLDETADAIFLTLKRAHSQAVFQKNDSDFGVKFLPNSYVLFQGNSYASRVASEDETFVLLSNVITSGIDEVVFAKHVGLPNVTGTLTMSSGNDSQSITINAQGKIERQ